MNITEMFRVFYQNTKEYAFSLTCHSSFSNIDHIVMYKAKYNIRKMSKSFYKSTLCDTKSHKDSTKKENILLWMVMQNYSKNVCKVYPGIHQKYPPQWTNRLHPGRQGWFSIWKSIKITQHILTLKEKKSYNLS